MILLGTVTAALCGAIYWKTTVIKNARYAALVEKYGEEQVQKAMKYYEARIKERRKTISNVTYTILVKFPFEIIKTMLSIAAELDTDFSSDCFNRRSLEDEIKYSVLDNSSSGKVRRILKDNSFSDKEIDELLNSSKDTVAREIANVVEKKGHMYSSDSMDSNKVNEYMKK